MSELLAERDARSVWHPLTQVGLESPPLVIEKAEGVYLYASDGTAYIDAISSWWVMLHGHSHPAVTARIKAQLDKLHHVAFAGCTHAPAIELAERLLSILPLGFEKIFYTDNGSSAVEASMKMALQFWQQSGQPQRKRFLSLENGYHGDTFGAMSVGSRSFFNAPFHSCMFKTVQIPVPVAGARDALSVLERELAAGDVAAFIYEPLLQGACGMRIYSAADLGELLEVCKAHDVLCIADEVFTGFWKTGTCFASEQCSVQPDIVLLSKALTAGSLPLAVLATTGRLFDAFVSEDRSQMFLHSHTFMANPLGCAAACASLELMQQQDFHSRRTRIELAQRQFTERISDHSVVAAARSCGLLAAFDVVVAGATGYAQPIREEIFRFCLERGVFLRPLGNTVYVFPPTVISEQDLSKVHCVLEEYLAFRSKNSPC